MELQKLLQDEIREGLYRITISGPRGDSEVSKVRIRPVEIKGKLLFQCQETVGTKEFHKNMTKDDVITRIRDWMNGTFKQMQLESDTCTASVLVSKKGTMTIKKKPHMKGTGKPVNLAHNRKKRYILEEGIPVPFLQDLGVMTKEGKIVRTRYDKFRQINRFLEFIEDILPQLPSDREITILDFGCGKSYLTFAMYYYFRELKKLDVNIIGLDLKEDVIAICNGLAEKYGYEPIRFFLISSSYRSPINYSPEVVEQGITALDRLYNCRDSLRFALSHAGEEEPADAQEIRELLQTRKEQFIAAMEDDLNTADAIAALFELVRDINSRLTSSGGTSKSTAPCRRLCEEASALFDELTGVLGLLYSRQESSADAEIEALIAARAEARKQKNWAESDRIRDELKAMGIVVEDTPQGMKWRRA